MPRKKKYLDGQPTDRDKSQSKTALMQIIELCQEKLTVFREKETRLMRSKLNVTKVGPNVAENIEQADLDAINYMNESEIAKTIKQYSDTLSNAVKTLLAMDQGYEPTKQEEKSISDLLKGMTAAQEKSPNKKKRQTNEYNMRPYDPMDAGITQSKKKDEGAN